MSPSNYHSGSLGGAVLSAVDAVVNAAADALSVADAGTREAFLDSWTRTLVDHASLLRLKGEQLVAPVVLVYVPNWAVVGKQLGWQRLPMLGSRSADPLAGYLGVGTLEVGVCVKPEPVSDTHSATRVLEEAGLGACLTIALLSSSELCIWPHGIHSESTPFHRKLEDVKVAMGLDALDKNLNEFYETVARQTRTWWLDSKQRIAVANTEAVVQRDLWLFLLGAYAERAKVKQEMWSGNGRTDLTLMPYSSTDSSAVLELKTTKDVATPQKEGTKPTSINQKTNIDWAISGVAQTAGYRDHEKFDGAYLCVYDFCAGNLLELEDAIQTAASQYSVHGRRYWITASNEEHRKDRYPLKASNDPMALAAIPLSTLTPTPPPAAEPPAGS